MANFNNWADANRIGNYFAGLSGYGSTETEEERRRREYEEAYGRPAPIAPGPGTAVTPVANTMVVPQQAAAPIVPTQPQPQPQPYAGVGLNPQQVQAESGGRNFLPNGQPVVSPKGAMFANQVMPATAQNPGFGIRPAAAQTPEEYNRVGNEYMDVMRKRYGGNEQAALAAYNAGPGTVDKNMAANQGQLNIPALPKETQQYIDKVLPPAKKAAETVLNAVIPSANAAETFRPGIKPSEQGSWEYGNPLQSAPTANNTAPNNASQGTAMAREDYRNAPAPGSENGGVNDYYDQKWYDMFQQAQNNPVAMAALANSPVAPDGIKQAAVWNQYQSLMDARNEANAKKEVAQAVQDPTAIARILKEKNEEGSWGKAILFSLLGSKSLAESEYAKLGRGAVWQQTIDEAGRPVLAQIRADGLPMRGYDIASGAELDPKQLASVAGGFGSVGKGIQTGQTLYEMSDKGTATLGNDSRWYRNGRPLPPGITPIKEFKEGVAARKAETAEAIKLKYTGPIAYTKASADFAGDFNAKNQTNIGYETITPGTAPVLVDRNNNNTPVNFDDQGNIQVVKNTQAPANVQTTQPGVAQSNVAQPGAAPVSRPMVTPQPKYRDAGNESESPSDFTSRRARWESDRKSFREGDYKEIINTSADSDTVVNAGKEIMQIVKNRPEVANAMNQPGMINIMTKIAAGEYNKSEGGPQMMEQELKNLNIYKDTPLYNDIKRIANIQSTAILPKQLRKIVGPGPVALPEQDMNKAAGIDPTQNPLYAGLSGISRRNLEHELIVQAATFAHDANSSADLDRFKKQEAKKIFADRAEILKAREAYLKKYNYSKEAQLQVMEEYPDPVLNTTTNQFEYSNGSKAIAEKAKRPPLSSFVR